MKRYLKIFIYIATFLSLVFTILFVFPKMTPTNAASAGHFKCVWDIGLSGNYVCVVGFGSDNMCTGSGESTDNSRCASYTTESTCTNSPEFACLTNTPTFQPTNANCSNRRGYCSSTTYPNCTENMTTSTCTNGGSNNCTIPYYVPMGTTNPYNLGACASKTDTPTTDTLGSPSNCPVCQTGWAWNIGYQQCQSVDSGGVVTYKDPSIVDCTSSTNVCNPGIGCNSTKASIGVTCGDNESGISTAIGCIHVLSDINTFSSDILKWAVGVGSGIAFILMLYAGFMIMTAQGNPERLKAGQELLTSAIAGLILIILSVFVLKFIGVDILKLGSLGFNGG